MNNDQFMRVCELFPDATFVEIGAGTPVTGKLFEFNGSSRIIHSLECPYSKELQESKYDKTKYDRSVSKEFIETVLGTIKNRNAFVSSWQVADPKNEITHGWVGIRIDSSSVLGSRNDVYIFHITLDIGSELYMSRVEKIKEIGKIGCRLIQMCINESFGRYYSDMRTAVRDYMQATQFEDRIDMFFAHGIDCTLEYIDMQQYYTNTRFDLGVCYDENGKPCRLVDMERKFGCIKLYKGSFNPVTEAHLKIIKLAGVNMVSISIDTYSKGSIGTVEMRARIKQFTDIGIPVLVIEKPFFHDAVEVLKNGRVKNIEFVMGSDTYNRFVECGDDKKECFNDIKFTIFNRFGAELKPGLQLDYNRISVINDSLLTSKEISSTQLRKAKEQQNG